MSKLFIVATPIGNLKDITLRALEVLRAVDVVLAEDTRVARKLLSHYDIKKTIISFHEHSSRGAFEKIISLFDEGKDCALVTDAGTPSVSDPGQRLIQLLNFQNIQNEGPGFFVATKTLKTRAVALRTSSILHIPKVEVTPIPGPSALTAILSVSDIDCSEFLFLGFPPHKKGRQKFFARVAESTVPVILFESTHRIIKTLTELRTAAGDRHVNIGRELTKIYEEVFRGTTSEALLHIVGEKQKGEFVLVIGVK